MEIIIILICYLIGSIPFGYLTGRLIKGIDIRGFGSKNIGATNVTRVVGKKWGILVFIFDFLKGFAAVPLLKYAIDDASILMYLLVSFAAIAGHNWTVFLKFKGGKGVSTSVGAICGLGVAFPALFVSLGAGVGSWAVLFFIFKYVSLASLLAAAVFFTATVFLDVPGEIKVFSFLIFVFIVVRHHKNIRGLLSKKERRF